MVLVGVVQTRVVRGRKLRALQRGIPVGPCRDLQKVKPPIVICELSKNYTIIIKDSYLITRSLALFL